MKRFFILLFFILHSSLFILPTLAQEEGMPVLEYVMTLKVALGEAYTVGTTAHGVRNVIPITGGTFEGPELKGIILPGGADWQMITPEQNRGELEAIYSIRTDDGVNIHIRNYGINLWGKDKDGKPQSYFRCAPKFEAPAESKYAWLNNSLFLCTPHFDGTPNAITLKIWRVD